MTEIKVNARFSRAQRTAILELMPNLADRLQLDANNQRALPFTLGELKAIQQKARDAVHRAESGMKRNSLRHVVDIATKAIENARGIGAIPALERLYQFKITLNETKPPIWRRIQVKNCTLDKLHEHIQTAMGWTNSHLHQFEIDKERYGDPELLDDGFADFECIDSTVIKIGDIVPKDGVRFRFQYEYDFGDGWQHAVLFEGCSRAVPGGRYPLCVEGERACPPEDVGGVWGYAEYLEAIADPEHERHEEMLEWIDPLDPDEFDPGNATKMMRRGLPNWRTGKRASTQSRMQNKSEEIQRRLEEVMSSIPCPVSGCWGLHGAETAYYYDGNTESHVLEIWPVGIEETEEHSGNGRKKEQPDLLHELAEFDFTGLIKDVPLEHFHFSQRRGIFEIGWTESGQHLELRVHIYPSVPDEEI